MLKYWGKTNEGSYHLLAYHSLDVAACAVTVLKTNKRLSKVLRKMLVLSQDEIESLIGWAAVLHDLGKLSPTFQRQDEATSLIADLLKVGSVSKKYDIRHDSMGWILWNAIESQLFDAKPMLRSARVAIRCASGHHGKPPSKDGNGTRADVADYFNPEDVQTAIAWSQWATDFFKPAFPHYELLNQASWWIAGIITLADWLGSNTEWFHFVQDPVDVETYFAKAMVQATNAVVQSGVSQDQPRRSYEEMFPTFDATPIQEAVKSLNTNSPFFLIIEETTGGGKTEAALTAAGGSNFFFGLPTMATANGLYKRVGVLDGQQTLIHGKSWAMPGAMDRATSWMAGSSRKALLADIGVGTIDQAMIGVMYSRYGTLRLAGLAGKTLIVDEVHAYDTYMKQILLALIEMQAKAGGSVILLSATMPLAHRQDYANAWAMGAGMELPHFEKSSFPLVTFFNEQDGVIEFDALKSRYEEHDAGGRRINIEHCSKIDDVVARILAEAGSGKCVAWIRNTVGEAIEAYKLLRELGADVSLFHSRYVIADRSRIESDVMATFGRGSTSELRRGKILIATQVIEQSLDIDFDFMVTDLCPVDLLIQRAGREHRHSLWGDRGTPVLLVYGPEITDKPKKNWVKSWSKNSGFVYSDHSKLWLTQQLISDGFSLPLDARRLVEGVYGEAAAEAEIPGGLVDSSIEFIGKELSKESGGRSSAIFPSTEYYEKSNDNSTWDDSQAPTRLGQKTNEWVIFENGLPISGDIKTSTISIEARKLTTALRVGNLKKLIGKWQEPINLLNGFASGVCDKKNVLISYDASVGLAVNVSS